MTQPVFRFAPSPNGPLHLGHALSALLNFEMAREAGGKFLLRIEDIDATRCRPEFERAIYDDLAWLGITWETPVRRQSEHLEDYRRALKQLEDLGLIYPSFESRSEIAALVAERETTGHHWPRDPDGAPLYPGKAHLLPQFERERRIAAGEPYALRLDMATAMERAGPLFWSETGAPPEAAEATQTKPEAWGDVVLARKETPTSYHLAVVVDDALQGITHVVRGQDLFASTSVHRLLQALLGLPSPHYGHHRLMLERDGHKLAKSTGAVALATLRREGAKPADIRAMIGLA
jgi:glutamyl-Q tRNA(Asp) synthetase